MTDDLASSLGLFLTHELGYLALRFIDGAFHRVAEAASSSVSVDVCRPPITGWIGRADDLIMRAAVFWHFGHPSFVRNVGH